VIVSCGSSFQDLTAISMAKALAALLFSCDLFAFVLAELEITSILNSFLSSGLSMNISLMVSRLLVVILRHLLRAMIQIIILALVLLPDGNPCIY